MKFSIITPVYNAQQYIVECMQSVLSQDYGNWEQIIINDGSSDATKELIEKNKHDKVKVIHNETRLFPAYSHYIGLSACSPDTDIVIHLDGDDKLINQEVLKLLSSVYTTYSCSATYGNYIASNGAKSVCRLVSGSVREQIRLGWPFSHLRTFSFKYAKFLTDDLLKDSDGKWLTSAADVAVITPLFELIGLDKIVFVNLPLCWYNRHTSLNEDKVNIQDQMRCAIEVYKKKPLAKICL